MATNRVQQALDTPIKPNWFTRGLQTTVNAANASPIGQFVQTQQSLGKTRIAQPILEAIQQAQQGQRLQAALNLLGAGVSATPIGNAQNMAETYASGGLQQMRGQGNAIQNARQLADTQNSGVVSQGLGIGGPVGALGDMAVGVNPKNLVGAVSNPSVMGFARVRRVVAEDDWNEINQALKLAKSTAKQNESLRKPAQNLILDLADQYVPKNIINKKKGDPVKLANWIIKNRKTEGMLPKTTEGVKLMEYTKNKKGQFTGSTSFNPPNLLKGINQSDKYFNIPNLLQKK